ncbi:hypothetical protein KIN20_001863 [Parelaphostrongylus tenuis]|uniref:Uncharacterized protein n=1 Tax=Parelaphostrongylus tenuis TaxID=148309 RepID=A0AAD5LUT8_PARTN|nr:hypothetical protein KIN20_001863 [Parelaphostrongylus tenuis]
MIFLWHVDIPKIPVDNGSRPSVIVKAPNVSGTPDLQKLNEPPHGRTGLGSSGLPLRQATDQTSVTRSRHSMANCDHLYNSAIEHCRILRLFGSRSIMMQDLALELSREEASSLGCFQAHRGVVERKRNIRFRDYLSDLTVMSALTYASKPDR